MNINFGGRSVCCGLQSSTAMAPFLTTISPQAEDCSYSSRPPHSSNQQEAHFFFVCFMMRALWMCGMTPPPAMVALIKVSSSSSPLIARSKCLGVILLTFKSFEAFPASSRTSAVRYSRMAAVYTAEVAPTLLFALTLDLRNLWILPTGNYWNIQILMSDDQIILLYCDPLWRNLLNFKCHLAKIFKLDHHKRQFRSENFVQTLQKREPCTYLKSGSGRSGGCNTLGELSCSKFASFCFTTFSWLNQEKRSEYFFKKSTKYPKNSKDASTRLLLAYCTF